MTTVILTEERLQTIDTIVKELPFKYAHSLVNIFSQWYQEAREMEQQAYERKVKEEAEAKQASLQLEPRPGSVEITEIPMSNTPYPKSRHG